jgi:hypothetical protein
VLVVVATNLSTILPSDPAAVGSSRRRRSSPSRRSASTEPSALSYEIVVHALSALASSRPGRSRCTTTRRPCVTGPRWRTSRRPRASNCPPSGTRTSADRGATIDRLLEARDGRLTCPHPACVDRRARGAPSRKEDRRIRKRRLVGSDVHPERRVTTAAPTSSKQPIPPSRKSLP